MEKLRALIRLLPDLEKSAFKAGSWVSPKPGPHGVIIMPYTNHSDIVSAFVDMAYQNGWVRSDFDWPEWAQAEEARRLLNEDTASATSDQLAKLLTICIRQDRFVEGALLDAFERGLHLRIVRRTAELLNAGQAS